MHLLGFSSENFSAKLSLFLDSLTKKRCALVLLIYYYIIYLHLLPPILPNVSMMHVIRPVTHPRYLLTFLVSSTHDCNYLLLLVILFLTESRRALVFAISLLLMSCLSYHTSSFPSRSLPCQLPEPSDNSLCSYTLNG